MCTLAWGQAGAGFWVCFNRDEKRSRPLAETPRVHTADPVPLIYARDPQGGGTWFAVSTAGFAIALLNNYPAVSESHPSPRCSRGQLVLQMASLPPDEAMGKLEQLIPAGYAPFFLFFLSPQKVHSVAWDGQRARPVEPQGNFWTTSSHLPTAIPAWRKEWWAEQTANGENDPGGTCRLLRRTIPQLPAHGPTMDRDDARTLSQIELLFRSDSLHFVYRSREPEGLGYEAPVVINHSLKATDGN